MATTSSPSHPALWWPTSETSTPTPAFATRASRSSQSRAPSWAGAAAGPAACPAQSRATPYRIRQENDNARAAEDHRTHRPAEGRRPRRARLRTSAPARVRDEGRSVRLPRGAAWQDDLVLLREAVHAHPGVVCRRGSATGHDVALAAA